MLNVTVLMDNTVLMDKYYTAEHGFSLYLEIGEKKILFDCGYSGAFLSNAVKMEIDLLDLDIIVLSHGHRDHTGGLYPYLCLLDEAIREEIPHRIPTLIGHPDCFYPRTKGSDRHVGSPLPRERVAQYLPLQLTEKPLLLTDELVYLGEIPRVHEFEKETDTGRQMQMLDGTWKEDLLRDDIALAYISPEGLVLLTGCAHSGLCNIISYAQKVTRETRIRDIIGGFHLIKPSEERMRDTLTFLQEVGVPSLHPCHCTSRTSQCAMIHGRTGEEAGVGLRLQF
ncbi:MAG: MBL fold metallo-hydrolase [Methanomicrobiales archaeon]|nr:MBL fold metallo-hydrolase [Methanomicrobiales archaeon]